VSSRPAGYRRGGVPTLLALLVVLGWASPAAADPAGPTHYDSRVTAVETERGDDGEVAASFEVLGGDAFLVVRATPGSVVEVPGYEGEPYVRIGADGTVEVNQRAPSRWINDERYETSAEGAPGDVAVDAPPRWEVVGTDGEYAWHDHRIHWMAPSLPRQVDPAAGTPQPVQGWTVPVVVDGQPVTVAGELVWLPGPSPLVPAVLVLAAIAAAAVLAWRGAGLVPTVIGTAALLALVAGASTVLGLPAGADADPFLLVLPALALAIAGAGLAVARRDARAPADEGPAADAADARSTTAHGGRVRGPLIATAAGLPLLIWAVLLAGALLRPLVPGPWPVGIVRVVVTVVAAAGLAGVLAAGRLVLAATSLDRPTSASHP
jgi:hypothetical protein